MRFLPLTLLIFALPAFAQYNLSAGKSAPVEGQSVKTVVDEHGKKRQVWVDGEAERDDFGNTQGTQYDLAEDGAFDGQTVAVIQLYAGTDLGIAFDFAKPKEALAQKGFSVFRWINAPPSPAVLEEKLKQASQLWIIGGMTAQITDAHVDVIKRFYESGRGLYLWGDNQPYSEDANRVIRRLFEVELVDSGSSGQQVIGLKTAKNTTGIIEDHLLTTGIEHIYEGHTIATLPKLGPLQPLIYGSDGKVVAGYYDRGGKRAIVDGGYTRLYLKWDTAGTGRYVKNAAAWLANAERFGDQVAKSGAAKSPRGDRR